MIFIGKILISKSIDRSFFFLLILLSSILILIVPSPLHAQYYVSPFEKVYEDLRYLQVCGFLQELNLSQIPITDIELLEVIDDECKSDKFKCCSKSQSDIFTRIKKSYLYTESDRFSKLKSKILRSLSFKESQDSYLHLGSIFDISVERDKDVKLFPLLRTFGMVSMPHGLSIVNIMTIDPHVTDNPDYIGKKWRGLSGYTEQAYLRWNTKYVRLLAGRSYIINGPGRKGALLFSDACRPLDNFRLDFLLGKFSFQSVVTKLDPLDSSRRYLSSHRLGIYFSRFQFAITELVLYGGISQELEFAYMNPFLFFHAEQMNGPGFSGNTLGTIDFRYLGKGWSFYGEFLIDDIQLDKKEPGDLEPNELGCILGADFADPFGIEGVYFGCEYAAITNRTYKTPNKYEFYIHRNEPIGYPLGSDLDRWNCCLRKYLNSWQIALEFDYIRRGEGEMDIPWDQPWFDYTVEEGYSEPFPTGLVEYIRDIGFEIRWMPTYHKYFYFSANYQSIRNYDHKDKNHTNFILAIGFYLDFKLKIF